MQEHRALGAYSILDRLRDEGFGSQPPVAYRALDFLVASGLVHNIKRLNALVITPFLMGRSRRIQAAVFSFIAGVMQLMPCRVVRCCKSRAIQLLGPPPH